jgi:putative tryptophan/tyrosine transport system substrate-binding protein
MKRRAFIAGLGSAAAWPMLALAQHADMPTVGVLSVNSPETTIPWMEALRQGLKDVGFIDGQNIAIEYRWGRGQFDRMPALAAELVDRHVNVLVNASGSPLAAKKATTTIPIVAMFGGDPVQSGLVASLNRPGGNLTGIALFAFSLGTKRLELLRELVPKAQVIAVLVNPSNPDPEAKKDAEAVEAIARELGQQLLIMNASNDNQLEPAFSTMIEQKADAVLVMANPFFSSQRERLVSLAQQYAIPAIYEWRQFADTGGLMSYGSSLADAYRKVGSYTGKILRGVKPSDLPVEQAVKIELILNLKTAKALGLDIPMTLLARADEVIE